MYLVPTKTVITEALRSIFDGSYPEADFRDVNVSIEFPYREQDYPGIWVQYEDNQDTERAGIDHLETITDDDGLLRQVTRWRFGGVVHFTVSAMSSQERDRLYDEMIRVLAFSGVDQTPAGRFKKIIEDNDLIGINLNFDVLTPSGDAANPGTPWDTNEIIYERTISTILIGEYVSDVESSVLYPLSRVDVKGYVEDDGDDFPDLEAGITDDWDPSKWT